jgi:hypothetical protein
MKGIHSLDKYQEAASLPSSPEHVEDFLEALGMDKGLPSPYLAHSLQETRRNLLRLIV